MGIIMGFLSIAFFCVLSAKAVTHRCHLEKADRFLMKIHKPVSGLFLIVCILHVILAIPVLKNRSIFVIMTGIFSMICMLFLICLCHIIKDKKKKILWHRILTIILAICIVSHVIAYIVDFRDYCQKVDDVKIENIDLTQREDGVYQGEYDAGYIYAKVEVEIKGGKIVSVTLLEHRNERGKPAEKILDDVVTNQQIDVDTVSGATNSSKVIKMAIANAIRTSKRSENSRSELAY